MVNMTCPVEYSEVDPVPFYHDGQLNFKAHDVGWIVAGFFTIVASTASFWLIWKHLTYFTCPQQQKHIVRMLIMVPIYAIVSFFSYFYFRQAIYYQTIRDCYEAVVITSFFYLLLQYVGDTPAEQHEVFRKVKLEYWFFPLGCWKYRPDGLHFLWLMKVCILQYAIVRPVCTLAAVGMEAFGIYCLDSWMPNFGHIWCAIFISISVSVAMYCIIQFYLPIQEELKPYSPVLKFLAVKSVVFLTFWQDSFLSILVYFDVIKESEFMTAGEIQVGINALLETFEMVIFAFLHIKAFTYLIYRPADHARVTKRGAAFLHVIDFRDWFFEMKHSTKYVSAKSRGRDYTMVEDIRADKYRHLQKALGRDRKSEFEQRVENEKLENALDFWKDPNYVAPEDLEGGEEKDGGSSTDVERTAGRSGFKVEKGYKVKNQSKLGSNSNSNSTPRTETKFLDVDDDARVNYLAYSRGMHPDDAHPELSQYHLYGTQPMGDGDLDDPSIARGFAEEVEQDYRSMGMWNSGQSTHAYQRPAEQEGAEGASKERGWWRSFKERVSGSLGGGEVEAEDERRRQHVQQQDQMYAKPSRETEEMDEKAGFLASPEVEDDLNLASPDARGAVPLQSQDPIGLHHHQEDSPLSQFISTISSTPPGSQKDDKYTQLPPRRSRASLNREGGTSSPLGMNGNSAPSSSSLRDTATKAQRPQIQTSRRGSNSPQEPQQRQDESPIQNLPAPQQPQVTLVRDNSLAAVSSKQGSVSAYVSSSNLHGTARAIPQSQPFEAQPPRSSPSVSFAPSANTFGRGTTTQAAVNSNASASGAAPLSSSSSQQRIMRSMSGIKGKSINIVLPSPLQPESFPFGAEGSAPEPNSAQAPLREPSPPPMESPVALNDKMERWLSTNASGSGSMTSRQTAPAGPVHKIALEMKGKPSKKTSEASKPKLEAKIVAGGQSLAQVRAEQEQEQARLEAEKRWDSQKQLSQQAVDWAAMQNRHGNSRFMNNNPATPSDYHSSGSNSDSRRERRTSAPPAPSFRVLTSNPAAAPATTVEKPQKKKKDKKGETPIIPLPAPSQFLNGDGDAFGAGAAAQSPGNFQSSRPRTSLDSARPIAPSAGFPGPGVGAGLQVGSIVSPISYPSAPGMPHQGRQSGRPHPNQQYSPQQQHWNGQRHPQNPNSPGNNYWQRNGYQAPPPARRQSDQHQSYFPFHPSQQSRPSPQPRNSYDRYTGESLENRESGWAREEQMREREMAQGSRQNHPQQARRTSAPEPPRGKNRLTGFQFEYLD